MRLYLMVSIALGHMTDLLRYVPAKQRPDSCLKEDTKSTPLLVKLLWPARLRYSKLVRVDKCWAPLSVS